jgi:hypothetical protein
MPEHGSNGVEQHDKAVEAHHLRLFHPLHSTIEICAQLASIRDVLLISEYFH